MNNPKNYPDALRKKLQRQFKSDFPTIPTKISVKLNRTVADVRFYDIVITNNPFRKGKKTLTLPTLQQEQNYTGLIRDQYQNKQNIINTIKFSS
jgi:hypothetical protein